MIIFALVKRARLRKRILTAQTSTPVLAQPGESLSLLFEMDKLKNFITNILGIVALAILWAFYAPYAICKALIDIEALKEFSEDVMIAIGNIRYEAGRALRRRSTHNAVINECMRELQKQEGLKDAKGNLWLGIHKFLKDQYK